jgi:hypothetical protein
MRAPAPHGTSGVVVVHKLPGASPHLGDYQRMLGVQRDAGADHQASGAQEFLGVAAFEARLQGGVEVDSARGLAVDGCGDYASTHGSSQKWVDCETDHDE